MAAIAGALAFGAASTLREGQPRPALRWLCEGKALDGAFAEIAQDDRLALELELDAPAHVYVAAYAPSLGLLALFPSQQLITDVKAPLAAGRHRLPGRTEGIELGWPALWPARSLTAMVVVSREPRPEIEKLFGKLRQMGNAAFRDRSMGLYAPREGGMEAVPAKGWLPDGLLRAAFDLTDNGPGGALVAAGSGTWIGTLKADVAEREGAERNPLQELQEKAALPPK